MTDEEFSALNALLGLRVTLHFSDGQSDVGTLFDVRVDLDGSQQLIYGASEQALYTPGEQVTSCLAYNRDRAKIGNDKSASRQQSGRQGRPQAE